MPVNSHSYFATLHGNFVEQEQALNKLDAAVGDGDHGTTMLRGLKAANAANSGAKAKAFMRASGGASGTLFGLIFHEIEQHLDNGASLAEGLNRAAERIMDLGEVQRGDKSMIDALAPAVDLLRKGGSLNDAVASAAEGRDATIPLKARAGRASYVENAGAGHVDPGAVSVHLVLSTLAETGA